MRKRIQHEYNGAIIEQRPKDGFINGTAMCESCGKDTRDWFRNEPTLELFSELAAQEGIVSNRSNNPNSSAARLSAAKYAKRFPGLVLVARGAPENGGGTWLHPKLAIALAQWCSPVFALQVSDWVMRWMMTGGETNPVKLPQVPDAQRIDMRLELKDEARVWLMEAVWDYYKDLEEGHKSLMCAKVHDEINRRITGQTSSEIRFELSKHMGRDMRSSELIRDYFPTNYLSRYSMLCHATTHFIREGNPPFDAIKMAVPIALIGWQVRPVEFAPHFKRLRKMAGLPVVGGNND